MRVDLLDPCPHRYLPPTLPIAVLGDVDQSAGGEVRIELVRLAAEVADAGLQQFAHIVREDLAGEPDGDTLSALCEEEGKLHRQIDRLLIGSVVRGDVVGDLGGEEDPLGEWRKACLDVARRRSTVAGEEVAPVPLTLDQELSLPQLHEGVPDARIAVRVELHRLTDDIRHLDQPILHLRHGVEDPSLHRLQPVRDVGHCPLQDDVRGIGDKPGAIHPRQHVVTMAVVGPPIPHIVGQWRSLFSRRQSFLRVGQVICSLLSLLLSIHRL